MTGDLKITVLSKADDAEYTGFLDELGRTQHSILGYHYPFFRDMLAHIGIGEPFYLAARRESKLVGVLPGFTKTTHVGTVYGSLPYFGPNAGVICRLEAGSGAIHGGLLGGVLEHVQSASQPVAASFYTPLGFDAYDHYERVFCRGVITLEKFTQSQAPSDYRPHRKLRYDLRKAEKHGVRVTSEVTPERLEEFYGVYAENCRTRTIPLKERETLDALLSLGVARGHVDLYLALRDGRVIAGCVILNGPSTVSVYMLATREGDRGLQPASLLVDYALREAADRGMRCWNWEASPDRGGVYQFKKKWGALESGYRTYVVPFQPPEFFQDLGTMKIQEQWPHFFVYPFSSLE